MQKMMFFLSLNLRKVSLLSKRIGEGWLKNFRIMLNFFKVRMFSIDGLVRAGFVAMRSNGYGRAYTLANGIRGNLRRLVRAAIILLCALGFVAGSSAFAMDRFAALSMVETGDNDSAIGPSGEISRYQVLPATWQHYAKGQALDPVNPTNSLSIAQAVMAERCAQFQKTNHRPPTDFEFYLLWNCPAHVAHPGKLATDTAQRFANLCQRH
jgi:hypothetical protein